MARLLLVDDNPSIHKIAETLLGPSYVQLVCVESAEAALALIEAGEVFDIALIDTTMPGMDGWQLLDRLRANPATSRIPVAMMAGVLDNVDQDRLTHAQIQGFLKKPIELRDLPERVRQLLGTPVSSTGTFPIHPAPSAEPVAMPEFVPTQDALPEPSPYATQPPGTRFIEFGQSGAAIDPSELETQPPGTKLSDLPGMAGVDPGDLITMPPGTKLQDLPGLRPADAARPVMDLADLEPTATVPGLELDLLLLTPADLLEEAPEEPFMDAPELDLEELDLDSLRGLPLEPAAAATLANEPHDLTPPAGYMPPTETAPTWDALPEPPAAGADFPMDLPELELAGSGFEVVTGEVLGIPAHPAEPLPEPPFPALEPEPQASFELPPIQTMDLDAGTVPSLEEWSAGEPVAQDSHPMAAAAFAAGAGAVFAAGAGVASAAPVEPALPVPAPFPDSSPAPVAELGDGPEGQLVKAVLANPALMDALARAVVAQLGDQALREIAWEVMPELAEKLQRPS
ncbi:MAG: response regulator [Holophagaceae bacterium]|nr:response regulator [Holophagaceae bacterium]